MAKNHAQIEKIKAQNRRPENFPVPPALNPHELRHTCASILIEKGVDLTTVSRFPGHSNSVITDHVYVHVNVEQLRKAIESTTTNVRQNILKNS